MVYEKGLDEAVADKIGEFVQIKGEPKATLAKYDTYYSSIFFILLAVFLFILPQ